jgi:hypothetical protein
MPYKDPESKRQWEREHREERNARRRRPISSSAFDLSHDHAPMPHSIAVRAPGTSVKVTVGVVMGLSLFLILLFAGWRLRDLAEPGEGAQARF